MSHDRKDEIKEEVVHKISRDFTGEDNGNGSIKEVDPTKGSFPLGANPTATPLKETGKLVTIKPIKANEALSIIIDYLKSGEIVIFGDMHRGERKPQNDEVWDRELFIDYIEQLGVTLNNFSVALELPHQLETKLNDPSVSVEDFLDEYNKLLAAKYSIELARANSEIRGPYLFRLLKALKRFNISVILIDDINSHRNVGIFSDIDAIEQSNKDMAKKLLEGRKKYLNDSILLMVGRNHAVPEISSIWLGGREINSIPGLLRESKVSVKLVRPDDLQYDEEDLAKFDVIIKIDEGRQKEYLKRGWAESISDFDIKSPRSCL